MVVPARLPCVTGPSSLLFGPGAPRFHLGLTPRRTFCGVIAQEPTGDYLETGTALQESDHPGLCRPCAEALERLRQLTAATSRSTLTWPTALVADGRSTTALIQSAFDARAHLDLIQQRLYPHPEDQRADTLLGFLADVAAAQKQLDMLADELVLALRDACRPAPSWERIGQRLDVKGTAVRHRYNRGAAEHPDRLTLCSIGGTGCGEMRPATLPGDHDPWKHHDLDHEGNPDLPQDDEDC
ncbi:hypothetical protein [Kitasatospora griseola]|uniref:hypothetical protein n=1 Tax=Kitasatospora griseola TaxID=2064 RepID=UPI0034250D83